MLFFLSIFVFQSKDLKILNDIRYCALFLGEINQNEVSCCFKKTDNFAHFAHFLILIYFHKKTRHNILCHFPQFLDIWTGSTNKYWVRKAFLVLDRFDCRSLALVVWRCSRFPLSALLRPAARNTLLHHCFSFVSLARVQRRCCGTLRSQPPRPHRKSETGSRGFRVITFTSPVCFFPRSSFHTWQERSQLFCFLFLLISLTLLCFSIKHHMLQIASVSRSNACLFCRSAWLGRGSSWHDDH